MQQEDPELVSCGQQGDLSAFNQIVERYQSQVYNHAARILGDRTTAQDITQETFISAHRALAKFRGGSLRAWLLRIGSNLSYDFIRKSRRRAEQSLDQSLENPAFAGRLGNKRRAQGRTAKGDPCASNGPADCSGTDRRPGTQLRGSGRDYKGVPGYSQVQAQQGKVGRSQADYAESGTFTRSISS